MLTFLCSTYSSPFSQALEVDVSSPLKICSLYSGSKGNCLFVGSERAKILIDAGKSARTLVAELCGIGESIEDIDAIFITHEHTDHVSALTTLSKYYHIPIYATVGCARALDRKYSGLYDCLVPQDAVFSEEIGDIVVSSFRTSHDSACSVGYKISHSSGFSAGLMTDTGIVTNAAAESLVGCDSVVLEANHDLDMLKNGPYPEYLKERVASRYGHLSNDVSARFAAYLAERGTGSFLLAHLSEENNLPHLALSTVLGSLGGYDCEVRVAEQGRAVYACK